MVGITLSAEQIRSAPPEVRRWLEHEIAATLGIGPQQSGDGGSHEAHLAGLSDEVAAQVFSLIQSDYVACQVFFELAREVPNSRSGNGLRAFSIAEIARHVRLGDMARLANCFSIINAAFRDACGNSEASLFGFDEAGCCYVSEATHQAIRLLWQRLVAGPQGAAGIGPVNAPIATARPETAPPAYQGQPQPMAPPA